MQITANFPAAGNQEPATEGAEGFRIRIAWISFFSIWPLLTVTLFKLIFRQMKYAWILAKYNHILSWNLAYSDTLIKKRLYYWIRERKNASAEVDYVEIIRNKVTPIEVKSGKAHSLRSLLIFLKEKHPPVFGLHFSLNNFYQKDPIQGLPLYAVCKLFQD